jgi:hypothetical protein
MMTFDYAARADLFVARGTFSRRKPLECDGIRKLYESEAYPFERRKSRAGV